MGGRGGRSHNATAGAKTADARAFLTKAYGVRHTEAILDFLKNAPATIQSMWEDYAGLFRAAPGAQKNSDRADYNASTDQVYLGINAVARGDSIHPPYATVFHEYGHMTDYLIARAQGFDQYTAYTDVFQGLDASGKPILQKRSGGGLLGRTAKRDLQDQYERMFNKYPEILRDHEAAQKLIEEATSKYSMLDRSDISDMMEGAGIGVAYPLGAGHGESYWALRDNGKEIFAEITSAEAAHPGSLKAIKEYFPRTYQVYQEMVKARKKK